MSGYSDNQIIAIIKQSERDTLQYQGSAWIHASFYKKWRNKYGGVAARMTMRLKEFEDEKRH